jgi:hypothetical protein
MSTKPNKKQSSKHANGGTFRKGDGRKAERSRQGTPNKMSRECKEMIADCFERIGGLEGLVKWATANAKNRAAFYTRMYIRLLPFSLDVRTHKDVVYHTVAEVNDRLGQAGMTLELIERLRRMEQAQPKLIDHVTVD